MGSARKLIELLKYFREDFQQLDEANIVRDMGKESCLKDSEKADRRIEMSLDFRENFEQLAEANIRRVYGRGKLFERFRKERSDHGGIAKR